MAEIHLDNTFGACFIGAMVTSALYGLTTLQTYFYFMNYPNDSLDKKTLVSTIWILDTVHTAVVGHCMYFYLVTNFNNPAALADGIWSLFLSTGVNVLIAVLVQIFFTIRIFYFTPPKLRWYLASLLMLIVIAHFAFGIETVILMFFKKAFHKLNEITLFAATPFAVTAVLSDILIAAALCILLHGSRTDFRSTNKVVTKLIVYAINRSLLTSVVAIVEVIVFVILPDTLWFVAIDFVIGKLYANSLLATLNTRNSLRGKGLEDNDPLSQEMMKSIRITDIHFRDKQSSQTIPTFDITSSKTTAAQSSTYCNSNDSYHYPEYK